MQKDPVPAFTVKGFRAIQRLELSGLKRVNLFVGENNAGKSSLLEALQLYLYRNSRSLPAMLLQIVRGHSDLRPPSMTIRRSESDPIELQFTIDAVEALFYGSFDEAPLQPIHLSVDSPLDSELKVSLPWTDGWETASRPSVVDPTATLLTASSEARSIDVPLDWFVRRVALPRVDSRHAIMVPSSGMSSFDIRQRWDEIAVSGRESLVEDAVRVVVPQLDRIIVIGESRLRTVVCKLRNVPRPIPIKAMGDAVNRVFGLAVAVAHARGGVVLIDEVENGLHHSIQSEVWKAVFAMTATLDVQVFATTHSWDAVVGFQEAANTSPIDGALFRLERGNDGIVYAESYTEKEVAIATEQQVEVR